MTIFESPDGGANAHAPEPWTPSTLQGDAYGYPTVGDNAPRRVGVPPAGTVPGLSEVEISRMAFAARNHQTELDRQAYAEAASRPVDTSRPRMPPGGVLRDIPRGFHTALDAIPPEIGLNFSGHGIAKGPRTTQLTSLNDMLTNGVTIGPRWYEMPLTGAEAAGGAFGAGRPFTEGGFIVLAPPGETIEESGIGQVLVNEDFSPAVPRLQEAYPHVKFIAAADAPTQIPEIFRTANPAGYDKAMEAISARKALAAAAPPAPSHGTSFLPEFTTLAEDDIV